MPLNSAALDALFGNDGIKKQIAGFAERAGFPHALIISGTKGSGKHTVAELIMLTIACRAEKKPCLSCESCRKIKAGLCPDIVRIGLEKDKKTIGVDAVRVIKETVDLYPNDLAVKFFLIEDADAMTIQAQNALLKLLEEPPAGVFFILLCTSSSGLLQTVRSRAPEMRTECFSEKELISRLSDDPNALRIKNSNPIAFLGLIRLAGGSYGEAKRLLALKDSEKVTEESQSVLPIFDALVGGNYPDLLLTVNRLAGDREKFHRCLLLLLSGIRDITLLKQSTFDIDLLYFADLEKARYYRNRLTVAKLLGIYELTETVDTMLTDTNVNLNTTALFFAEQLWQYR